MTETTSSPRPLRSLVRRNAICPWPPATATLISWVTYRPQGPETQISTPTPDSRENDCRLAELRASHDRAEYALVAHVVGALLDALRDADVDVCRPRPPRLVDDHIDEVVDGLAADGPAGPADERVVGIVDRRGVEARLVEQVRAKSHVAVPRDVLVARWVGRAEEEQLTEAAGHVGLAVVGLGERLAR